MKTISHMKKITGWLRRQLKPIERLFESDLERAIRKEEFVFFYQPQVDLVTGSVKGVEALLRWHHPQKGMISPAEFIPMLERTKLINELSVFLFRQSMEDLKLLHNAGFKDLFMTVNLSAVQLEDDKLVSKLEKQLKKTKIDPKFYECEITETSMMENIARDVAVLKDISNLGVKLSIDDFGSGYAGFNYLRRLNIQKLKIDMEFVSSLFEHKNNEIILSAMMDLGHQLKLEVLAEGVETKKQEEWLKQNGCGMAQGFYFARPMPFNDLIRFLEQEKNAQDEEICLKNNIQKKCKNNNRKIKLRS
ncbi:MAG: EAL domain-containing protein [Alphaproteobacteria bacterium]|nr:EAL domain-containing protein [Alphaproteobacteria bacterium]